MLPDITNGSAPKIDHRSQASATMAKLSLPYILVDFGLFLPSRRKTSAKDYANYQERKSALLLINKGDERRNQKYGAFYSQHLSQYVYNHSFIHFAAPTPKYPQDLLYEYPS